MAQAHFDIALLIPENKNWLKKLKKISLVTLGEANLGCAKRMMKERISRLDSKLQKKLRHFIQIASWIQEKNNTKKETRFSM